jgi:hypothetical protein
MADSTCLKMHIAITAVAIATSSTIEIADHRKGHAGVTGQVLPQAQTSGPIAGSRRCTSTDSTLVHHSDWSYNTSFA